MSFSMSSLSLVLPARLGARRAPRAAPAKPAPLLSSFEGGLRRCAGLGESTASEGAAALGAVDNGCKWSMMRHGKKIHRLGRPADQRKALLRALTTQILTHGAIKTTKQKAVAVRPWVDKMILLAKAGGEHKRKQMNAWLYDKTVVDTIFEQAPERYAERRNDFTKMTAALARRGDNASMVVLELV